MVENSHDFVYPPVWVFWWAYVGFFKKSLGSLDSHHSLVIHLFDSAKH